MISYNCSYFCTVIAKDEDEVEDADDDEAASIITFFVACDS